MLLSQSEGDEVNTVTVRNIIKSTIRSHLILKFCVVVAAGGARDKTGLARGTKQAGCMKTRSILSDRETGTHFVTFTLELF